MAFGNQENLGKALTVSQIEKIEELEKLIDSQILAKLNLQRAYVRLQDRVAIGVEIHGLRTDLELLEHLRRQDNSAPIVSIY